MLQGALPVDSTHHDSPGLVSPEDPPAGVPRLSAVGLTCVRDDRVLFRDLSLSVSPGDVLQVDGRNGSGKTSLLRILCGLSLPAEGQVLWDGEPIARVRSDFLLDLAYLGHAPGVKLELTPIEILRIARDTKGTSSWVAQGSAAAWDHLLPGLIGRQRGTVQVLLQIAVVAQRQHSVRGTT